MTELIIECSSPNSIHEIQLAKLHIAAKKRAERSAGVEMDTKTTCRKRQHFPVLILNLNQVLLNILNKQGKRDRWRISQTDKKRLGFKQHPLLPFLDSARRWNIWCVCIHPPLYTCYTLEERCNDRSPPMNTNEQVAVICLGIRDETEQRARLPRNEWCLSAQHEPNTFNARSTRFFTYYYSCISVIPPVWHDFLFQICLLTHTQKTQFPSYIAPGGGLCLI